MLKEKESDDQHLNLKQKRRVIPKYLKCHVDYVFTSFMHLCVQITSLGSIPALADALVDSSASDIMLWSGILTLTTVTLPISNKVALQAADATILCLENRKNDTETD